MPFSSFGLHPDLLEGVRDLGLTHPTNLQKDALPPILGGRDLMALAATGSGKTAAYLLPVLHGLIARHSPIPETASEDGETSEALTAEGTPEAAETIETAEAAAPPAEITETGRALILAPSRELTIQIREKARAFAHKSGLRIFAVCDGGDSDEQLAAGFDLLVAVPTTLPAALERLPDLLAGVDVLVLDEVDRMLGPELVAALDRLPEAPKQRIIFANLPSAPVTEFAHQLLREPTEIGQSRPPELPENLDQAAYEVREELKAPLLLELLRRDLVGSVVVFARTKHRANRLTELLAKNGIVCDRIHGNRSPGQRAAAIASFNEGRLRALVATDVAARGMGVEGTVSVIHFDAPTSGEDYLQRVTLSPNIASSISLVAERELGELRAIERILGTPLPRRTIEDFDYAQEPEEKLEAQETGEARPARPESRRNEERPRGKKREERKAQPPKAPGAEGGDRQRPRKEPRQPQPPRGEIGNSVQGSYSSSHGPGPNGNVVRRGGKNGRGGYMPPYRQIQGDPNSHANPSLLPERPPSGIRGRRSTFKG
ncbi:MAG TPA: DEAD/DEAH box helicase [Thermoanaerobaculia bacterium]|jgi:ATP-dependent RNA helicase RhlE|nr:DEAD/DEAH box helicase [Thermoanaerobaculia bacterium]